MARGDAGGDTSRNAGAPALPCVSGSLSRAGRLYQPVVPAVQNAMVTAAHFGRPISRSSPINEKAGHRTPLRTLTTAHHLQGAASDSQL